MAAEILSDQDLLRRMAAGDEEAFVTLYRRWSGCVYRFARQMSGSTSIAEDVTQDVFLALIREAERFDADRGSFPAYLYGMTRNLVRRAIERASSFVTMQDGDGALDQVEAGDLFAEMERAETVARVRRAILALPVHYREVVILCDLHGMSYAEAAAALGCAIGTIRSRLNRARALLSERLGSSTSAPVETKRCYA
jgi:RNA polymerase sigma-70 factor (ECF subfamily)